MNDIPIWPRGPTVVCA